MRKIKRGTLKTRTMEIKSRLMYMYGAVFLKPLYQTILEKVTQGNRPLFPSVVINLFLWYEKWTIASESVDELIVLRKYLSFEKVHLAWRKFMDDFTNLLEVKEKLSSSSGPADDLNLDLGEGFHG